MVISYITLLQVTITQLYIIEEYYKSVRIVNLESKFFLMLFYFIFSFLFFVRIIGSGPSFFPFLVSFLFSFLFIFYFSFVLFLAYRARIRDSIGHVIQRGF